MSKPRERFRKMHKNKFLILDIQRGMAWQGQAGSKIRWMVLCFGKMFHKCLHNPIESSATGNNVPSAGECIAKTEENGYNSSKTNLQKIGTTGNRNRGDLL